MNITSKDYVEYNVGDTVTIRSWQSLKEEYLVDVDYIEIYLGFTPNMRRQCGKKFLIGEIIQGSSRRPKFILKKFNGYSHDDISYTWGSAMFEESIQRIDSKLFQNSDIKEKFNETFI